jgi:hypothetical protein
MTRAPRLAAIASLLLLAATAGCQMAPAASADQRGLCQRAKAEALAGRDRITDDEARQLTGASLVRQVKPGDGVTMDYREERVTIETDPETGKIIRAYCG